MKTLSKAIFLIVNVFGIALFTWPLFLDIETSVIRDLKSATWISVLLAFCAVLILFFQVNDRLLDSKIVAIVAVLVGLISALRLLGAGAVGIEPMWFLLILAARVFGAQIGLVIATLSILVSGIITGGIGPWLPFQMLAAGWIAVGTSIVPVTKSLHLERAFLMAYGAAAALFFGLMMDLQLWPWLLGTDTQLSYLPGASVAENLSRFMTFHLATALTWDLPRAIITATLILITAKPILGALRRARFRLEAVAEWKVANELEKVQRAV